MNESFLDGITAVELSRGPAAAFCCRLLADWGAEVIKVEPPGGDLLRTDDPALFERLNAGKKSITLDLINAAGTALLHDIASYVEALVEDGVVGLDYESPSAESRRLVVTSVRPSARKSSPSAASPVGWESVVGLNAFDATLAALIGVTMTEQGQQVVINADECLAAVATLASGGSRPPAVSKPTALFRTPLLKSAGSIAQPGEHNDEVYGEMLGLSQEELAMLRTKGVV